MTTDLTLAELEGATDLELEPSDWFTVEQSAIESFAEATGDHNWIHVDPERALWHDGGPRLPLPLAATDACRDRAASSDDAHGAQLRHRGSASAPVPSGSQVRLKATVRSSERRGEGVLYRLGVELEIQGADKPRSSARSSTWSFRRPSSATGARPGRGSPRAGSRKRARARVRARARPRCFPPRSLPDRGVLVGVLLVELVELEPTVQTVWPKKVRRALFASRTT